MIFIPRRKIVVGAFFLLLFMLPLLFSPKESTNVISSKISKKIIIDAGHGFPDGGAIGSRGTVESTLNIKIARLLEDSLKKKGYSIIMTRTTEDALTLEGNTISQRKHNDMHKRLEIINSSDADIFVSIHMNKFSDSKYSGAQVIYSGNFPESENLASLIQNQLCLLEENKSKRSHLKAPGSIFLLKNAKIPAVIVECGFLSNFEEEELLGNKKYQKKLAGAISKGIQKYYSGKVK